MELLDVRHRVLLHLLLEDAPPVLNTVQVWRHTWPLHHLQQQGSCHLGGVVWVVVMYPCFPQWTAAPSASSSHAAPDHNATTTMHDCRQGTIFLVLFTRASPHMLDTIWAKQVYLRLIRPQGMVPVIHALGQVVFSKLFAGFFCEPALEEASFWDDGHANRLVAVCGVWSEHWQADLPLLQPLKQCWQHSCICFWSQLLHLTHSTRTQLLWSTLARPVPSENHFGKPLYDHGHSTVTQYQVVTELLISYAIFVESNNSNSQILREFFAMRCHVEHPVASMRELYSKNQIWPALNKIHKFVWSFQQTHEHDE